MMKKKKELALEREEKVKGERGEEGEKDRKRVEKEKPTVRSGPGTARGPFYPKIKLLI